MRSTPTTEQSKPSASPTRWSCVAVNAWRSRRGWIHRRPPRRPATGWASFRGDQDDWGGALVGLMEAWGAVQSAELRLGAAERAIGQFRRLGAGTLEAWARGLHALALARMGSPDARDAALAAESIGRSSG